MFRDIIFGKVFTQRAQAVACRRTRDYTAFWIGKDKNGSSFGNGGSLFLVHLATSSYNSAAAQLLHQGQVLMRLGRLVNWYATRSLPLVCDEIMTQVKQLQRPVLGGNYKL
jgi:hypothetical protein